MYAIPTYSKQVNMYTFLILPRISSITWRSQVYRHVKDQLLPNRVARKRSAEEIINLIDVG
jgi:hypothetical protein